MKLIFFLFSGFSDAGSGQARRSITTCNDTGSILIVVIPGHDPESRYICFSDAESSSA